MHGAGGPGTVAAGTAAVDPVPGGHPRPLLQEEIRRTQVQLRRRALARRPAPAAVHNQAGPARQLPLRPVRRAPARRGAGAFLVRHLGPGHRGRLHPQRHQDLVQPGGPGDHRRRRHQKRRHPDRLRLRPVHRRLRPALRRRVGRYLGHPDLLGQHQAADPDHAGLQDHRPGLHPVLRPGHGRHHDGDGHQPQRPVAALRPVRRRALVRGHAPGDQRETRHHRHRQLRPVRGHGPRRVRRVPGVQRPAHQRGPLPARDPRPQHPGAGARGRGGRTGDHHPDQGGLPHDPLPHPRPDPVHSRALRLRSHHAADAAGDGPDRRHAHHQGRERVPDADREGAVRGGRHRAALPDHR